MLILFLVFVLVLVSVSLLILVLDLVLALAFAPEHKTYPGRGVFLFRAEPCVLSCVAPTIYDAADRVKKDRRFPRINQELQIRISWMHITHTISVLSVRLLRIHLIICFHWERFGSREGPKSLTKENRITGCFILSIAPDFPVVLAQLPWSQRSVPKTYRFNEGDEW